MTLDPWNIVRALWLFLPAYAANMAPVFVAKLIPGWKAPIDGGRVMKDGQRVLGKGKTWRGLAGGAALGGLLALLMAFIAPHWNLVHAWDFGANTTHEAGTTPCLPGVPCDPAPPLWAVFTFGALVGGFALIGDAVKSYFKRRRNKGQGTSWFPFDQLDFVVFGLLGMVLGAALLPPGWVQHSLLDDPLVLLTLLVLTPLLHLLVNRVGYWLGLKEVPW